MGKHIFHLAIPWVSVFFIILLQWVSILFIPRLQWISFLFILSPEFSMLVSSLPVYTCYSPLLTCCCSNCCSNCWKCFSKPLSFLIYLCLFLLPIIPMFIFSNIPARFIGLSEIVYDIEFTPQTVNIA